MIIIRKRDAELKQLLRLTGGHDQVEQAKFSRRGAFGVFFTKHSRTQAKARGERERSRQRTKAADKKAALHEVHGRREQKAFGRERGGKWSEDTRRERRRREKSE